ncbi:hypothetical protein HZB60_11620 [candidate division KSB1 bacterium]|nr:hypothetical protein [candidate division KSB1 bacterium]
MCVAILALCWLSPCALAKDIEVTTFDKRLVLVEVEGIASSGLGTMLAADSAKLKDKAGIAIHLTGESPTDAELQGLLARLTDEVLAADSLRIEPAADWQFVRPLVLSVPAAWAERPLLKLFIRKRPYAELETSGLTERAKNRLRELLFKAQNELRQKLERMFQGR